MSEKKTSPSTNKVKANKPKTNKPVEQIRKPENRVKKPVPTGVVRQSDRPRVHKSYEMDSDLQFDMVDIDSIDSDYASDDYETEYAIGDRKPAKKKSGSKSGSGKSSKGKSGKKKMSKKARLEAARKRSQKRFLIFLAIYTGILLVLGGIFLGYTDSCLKKYEAAQSQYEMEKYFQAFKASLDSGEVPAEVNLGQYGTSFDSMDDVKNMYLAFAKQGELRFEKDKNSYNTEEPVYNILAGDTPIHAITLRGVNEHTIFGILTIMDWEKADSKCLYSPEMYEYYIRVPEGFQVELGGHLIDDSYRTDSEEDIELFQFAREYATLPALVEYKVNSYQELSGISIVDNNGNPVEGSANGNVYTAFYKGSEDMPDDLKNSALSMAETWSKFMTSDLSGNLHGFYTLESYLIKGSYLHSKAKEYAGGIDITFISGHTLDADPFSNVKVDDYVRYNDNCFSCHIYFEKVMHLNRGTDAMDITDSTFIFAYYDDSEDGVDNPHWAIVDMIANTN